MAGSVADMLVGSALQSADKAPDIGGAIESGVGLAMKIQQVQQQQQQLDQAKQAQYTAKIEKFASLYDTAAKLPPGSARNGLFKTVIPKTRDALGLQKEFPDDSMVILNANPEVVGYLKSKVEAGELTLPKLLENMQDAQWIADNVPAALQAKAGKDLTPQVTEEMESLQKSDNFRIKEANDKKNAEIVAAGQAQRAIDDDNRAGGKKLSEEVAKKYADYSSGGGSASMNSALENLTEVSNALKTGKVKTGGVSTRIPVFKSDDAQSMLNPEALKLKTQAQSALNTVLRQTLGAQFTENEGARVLSQVWDDRLSPASNALKLDRKIKELKANQKNAESEFKRFGFMKDQATPKSIQIPQEKKDAFKKLDSAAQKKALSGLANLFGVDEAAVKKELGIK